MKKLLAVLGIITIAGSTAATLVACGKSLPVNTDIWLITDAGKVQDKSFNQSGFNGGNYFLQEVLEKKENISYTEPPTIKELGSAYTNAKADGAKTLILPGFHHAVDGKNEAAQIMGSGSTIILDSNDGGKPNQIGIMYRGDISGFLATFGGMIELSNNPELANKGPLKMGTFGGSHNAGAVDNFMVGFLAAINVFNKIQESNTDLANRLGFGNNNIKFDRLESQKLPPKGGEDNTGNADERWFTNSFTAGGANQITADMLNEGATVIMPVAGPQTSDVLGKMKDRDNGAKEKFIIGVDTDQSQQYTDKDGAVQNRFLSSAQKSLVESTVIALGHSKEYVGDETIQDTIVNYAKENESSFTISVDDEFIKYDLEENKADSWEGKTLWMGGKAATGGKNQLKDETSKKVNSIITTDILEKASKELFVQISNDDKASTILSDETVNKYANSIFDAIIDSSDNNEYFNELKTYYDLVKDTKLDDETNVELKQKFLAALDAAKEAIENEKSLKDNTLKTNLEAAFNALDQNKQTN